MSGSVNKVILVGRLTKDPEARSMNNGGEVVSFSIATSENWKDKGSGEKKEKTEFHNVVIFNEHLGTTAKNYLRKGSSVYIEGALQTRKWQDQSGADRYVTEVVLQRFKGELTLLGDSRQSEAKPAARTASAAPTAFDDDELDDTVPFLSAYPHRERRIS